MSTKGKKMHSFKNNKELHVHMTASGEEVVDVTYYDDAEQQNELAKEEEAQAAFDRAEAIHDAHTPESWEARFDVDEPDYNKEDGTMQSYIGTWWIKAKMIGPVEKPAGWPGENLSEPFVQSECEWMPSYGKTLWQDYKTQMDVTNFSRIPVMKDYAALWTTKPLVVKPKHKTRVGYKPSFRQPLSDGWVAGEREKYEAQQDQGPSVDPGDILTEGERQLDARCEASLYRQFSIEAKFAALIARTKTDAADGTLPPKNYPSGKAMTQREIGRRRIYGLGMALERIVSEIVAERQLDKADERGCDDILASDEAVRNHDAQIRSEINAQARRHGWKSDQDTQKNAESEIMRDDKKAAWVTARTEENQKMMYDALGRYYKEFGTGTITWKDGLFPMWEQKDGRWSLVQKPLALIYAEILSEKGDEYKAMWTMAKMVDNRYEAQLKYKRSNKKNYADVKRYAA